jgi:flavorubredoxin
MTNSTRIDHIVGGIYRISTFSPDFGISFNQFLIDDERPALLHTGTYNHYEGVRSAISEVLDPKRLAHIILLHWEGDENGGMDRFMAQAPESELVGSAMSIMLNASGFGLQERTQGFTDDQTLELGEHRLRFLETPHVHHWDSMMLVEETTNSLFPSDLYLQPGDQPPTIAENLSSEMLEVYRDGGIFAHEKPVRAVADRIEQLAPDWIHAMHGATIKGEALHYYGSALREQEFAYRGLLLGREIAAPPPVEA